MSKKATFQLSTILLTVVASGAACSFAQQTSPTMTVQPRTSVPAEEDASAGVVRPALEIIIAPDVSRLPASSSGPRASVSASAALTRTVLPVQIALPAPDQGNGPPAPFAIDEFQYQFLTEDGLRLRHNFPVEFVSSGNLLIKQQLQQLFDQPGPAALGARALTPATQFDALRRSVLTREYLRRLALDEPAEIGFAADHGGVATFNGEPVSGGHGSAPFVLGGEPVVPTPLERFPRYRDNQASMVRSARIFLGQPTEDFRDVALLIAANGAICSGILIAPRMVLSAAHCACGADFKTIIFGTSRNAPMYSSEVDGEPITFKDDICGDGSPDAWTLDTWHKGDLALFKLKTAVHIEPRRFAPAGLIDQAASVTVVGFGRTEFGSLGFKYKADVEIATSNCSRTHLDDAGKTAPEVFGCAEDRELVAASKKMRDTCEGDSGGPAFVRLSGDDSAEYFLAAVTSRSTVHRTRVCGDGGVYVRIYHEIEDWLRAHAPAIAFADPVFTLASASTDQ